MMRAKRIAGNIYKLLRCTVVGDVVLVESIHDATKLWHMRLGHLSDHEMMKLHKKNLLKVTTARGTVQVLCTRETVSCLVRYWET